MRQQCAYIGILKTLTFQNEKEEEITDIKMLLAEFMDKYKLNSLPIHISSIHLCHLLHDLHNFCDSSGLKLTANRNDNELNRWMMRWPYFCKSGMRTYFMGGTSSQSSSSAKEATISSISILGGISFFFTLCTTSVTLGETDQTHDKIHHSTSLQLIACLRK